ncbi:hypothetical protein D1O30_10310 [Methylocystis hirsuta]|uniref:Uncharacterized protein n=1 Tax=Methylocystis hirsuta TaxID=369798 RepID=A0A3M9XQK5_9HYPH|nr:hypothetical protein D1O30_10310 [Methylocystis hirsuta]
MASAPRLRRRRLSLRSQNIQAERPPEAARDRVARQLAFQIRDFALSTHAARSLRLALQLPLL